MSSIVYIPPTTIPTTLNGVEIVGTAGIVKQGGVQVGTVDPATGIVTVPECASSLFDLVVKYRGVTVATVNDLDPTVDNTINLT